MKIPIGLLLALLVVPAAASPAEQAASPPPRWAAFALDELRAERAAAARPWLEVLEVDALSAGLYVLPAGGPDRQRPHDRDEVYYVISGRAVLEVDGERQSVRPGAVIYVKARVEHRFVEIEETLEVLVFFSAVAPAPAQ